MSFEAQDSLASETSEVASVETSVPTNAIPVNAKASSAQPNDATKAQVKTHTLTDADFKAVKDKAAKAQLIKMFGTDDASAIQEKLRIADELQAKADEQRRAQLSESEKLKEDLARLQAEKAQFETKAQAAEKRLKVEKETRRLAGIAAKYINAEDVRDIALPKLKEYLRTNFSARELNRLSDKDIEKFFAELARKKPGIAKAQRASQPAPATKRVPVTTGPRNPKAEGQSVGVPQKSVKEMSKKEIREKYGVGW